MTTSNRPSWFRRMFLGEVTPRFHKRSSGFEAFEIQGDCAMPYLAPGDHVLVDSNLDVLPGELIVARVTFRSFTAIGAGALTRIENVVKQLVISDGERYLTCATGRVSADNAELVGPVVAAWRRGWRRRRQWPLDRVHFNPPVTEPATVVRMVRRA
jgi:hypothetical protein